MIVAIADDITGAAEIGGIGLRYGLRVLITDGTADFSKKDLVVFYTNTRSMPEAEAVKQMESLTAKARALQPSLFYKKIDSVLRGHVLAETEAQMEVLRLNKALIVPANPALGRTISGGHYHVNGQHIHHTGFFADPEFPVRSSAVKDMLRSESVKVISKHDFLERGISVGEAESVEDVEAWARCVNKSIFLAGSGSFFAALLANEQSGLYKKAAVNLSLPLLLISGTTYEKSRERRKAFRHLVSYMPSTLLRKSDANTNEVEKWAADTIAILIKHGKAIIAIGENENGEANAEQLREKLSDAVNLVLQKNGVRELLIEGGSTAFAVLQKAGFSSFMPTEELRQGVVRMQVEGQPHLHLTIKPGSYDWPEEWSFN